MTRPIFLKRIFNRLCVAYALTAGGQEPRECGDLFGPPWQLGDGGRCDLG